MYLFSVFILGVDVYLAKIVPPDEDEHWCRRTKTQVNNIIKSLDCTENDYFTGRIVLQIGTTVWLDDIKLQKDLQYSNEIVTIFSLKKKMLDMQLCRESEQQLRGLYSLCESCNVQLPIYEFKNTTNARKSIKQVQPQWAYLEDGYNIVYFCSAISPHKVYFRQEKFDKL